MFTFRCFLCLGRFNYPFLIWEISVWFVCHYWTLITYSHIFFSCFLKIFPYYFLFLSTVNKQVIFFDCRLILFEYLLQWNALNYLWVRHYVTCLIMWKPKLKCLWIDLLCWSTIFKQRLPRKLLCYFYICHN